MFHDLKISARQLARRPLFTLTAVLTLAVGLGINAVAFTIVNGLLFKRPVLNLGAGAGRIDMTPGGDDVAYASLPEYERLADGTRGALDIAAEGRLALAWRHEHATDTAWVLVVSPSYFSIVGATPLAGRVEVAHGTGGTPSVVIGERFWRRSLNAAPLAGLTLRLNDTTVNVAGVLPEAFRGPGGLYSPDVWLPLEELASFHASAALQKRDERWLFVFGRIEPGVGAPEVQARVEAAAAAMAHDWPDTHTKRSARFRLLTEANGELRGLSIAAAVAMGIIGLVLLLACFNVTNLLLARAVERERDMAIRAAIGAGAGRLVRLVITEGLLIACLAGAAALVLAGWTQALVGSFAIPIEQPQFIDLEPDATVSAFLALLIVIAGVLPGLWPALAAARVDVARTLGSQGAASGGRPSPMRRWLVGAQVAGSTAFLAIAALFIQSYGGLSLADLGFDRDRLVVAEVEPAAHGYDADRSARYVDALLARVRALPGVAGAVAADRVPFFVGYDRLTRTARAGDRCQPDTCPSFPTFAVGHDYFRTMGIAMTGGREFSRASRSEVIVNQPLARALWPDGGGLGETLRLGDSTIAATVVGITARAHTRGLDREQPVLYVPIAREHYAGGLTIVARTAGAPARMVRPLVDAAHEVDPNVSLLSAKTMDDRIAVQMWPFRTVSWLFSICGSLALLLATVGLGAVVIHAVNRRMKEFGVRISMGATPRDLMAEVLRSSGRLFAPGLVVGMLVAAAVARLVQAAFVGVNVLNPSTYLAVALAEAVVVALACIAPALRAARTDPLIALRSD